MSGKPTHGHTANGKISRTYKAWQNMKERCRSRKRHNSSAYTGRGIVVCDEWLDFANFLEDMGECPKGLTLDRIDNNMGYLPNNCRWATHEVQARNKSDTDLIEFHGKTLCLTDWAAQMQHRVSQPALWRRLYVYGWSIEKALTTPIRKQRKANAKL